MKSLIPTGRDQWDLNKSEFSECIERAWSKCWTVILLHADPFAIDDLGIARLCILFFFRVSDCRHLRAEYRSVTIDQLKDVCWLRNCWSHACIIYCLSATLSVMVVENYLCMKPREYSFFPLGFSWDSSNDAQLIISYLRLQREDSYIFKRRGTVRPLPVPELVVQSDSIYWATLWLQNPGPNHCLHNLPCDVLMILDHKVTLHVNFMLL